MKPGVRMDDNKLETITKLFESKEIRSLWDPEKEDYYFSVVDICGALSESKIPRNYWSDLKRKLRNEGSELHEKIMQLKMQSSDGKSYTTDTLDTQGIFRLIESIPSPKAEPLKNWLAILGKERIDKFNSKEELEQEMLDWWADIKIPATAEERAVMVEKIDQVLTEADMLDKLIVNEISEYRIFEKKKQD